MALGITLDSGSPLIGSPVFYKVTASDLRNKPNLTFHRVIVEVSVSYSAGGMAEKKYPLSKPVPSESSSTYVYVDISSALRAYLDIWEYEHQTSGTTTYPVLTVKVKAWDEFMSNGILTTNYEPYQEGGQTWLTRYYLMGAFTDRERITSNKTRGVSTLTRKPVSGEVVPHAGIYVAPPAYSFTENAWFTGGTAPAAPTTVVTNLASQTAGRAFTLNGRSIYVDGQGQHYTAFQFVNGYGVLESAFALTLPEEGVTKEVKEYVVTVPMQFNKVNRNVVQKPVSRHTFKMSSGFVTEAWHRWWQEEFLNTPQAWMLVDSDWLPCSIIPSEDTAGINRTEDNMPEVQFTVKLNINGI